MNPVAKWLGITVAVILLLISGATLLVSRLIDEAELVEHLGQPLPLFRQEAGVLLIGAPVLEVDFAVRDVPVAAQDDLTPFCTQGSKEGQEGIEKTELGLLTLG